MAFIGIHRIYGNLWHGMHRGTGVLQLLATYGWTSKKLGTQNPAKFIMFPIQITAYSIMFRDNDYQMFIIKCLSNKIKWEFPAFVTPCDRRFMEIWSSAPIPAKAPCPFDSFFQVEAMYLSVRVCTSGRGLSWVIRFSRRPTSQGPEQKSQVVEYGQPFDLLMEGQMGRKAEFEGPKGDHVLTCFDRCWFEIGLNYIKYK